MKKQYVLSALVALAFTLGMSTGEARAKKDLAQGKTVKEKHVKKHAQKAQKKKRNH